jgi:hypothetical protein
VVAKLRPTGRQERGGHRPHQGLGNELISPLPTDDVAEGERLGGLLRSFRRAA